MLTITAQQIPSYETKTEVVWLIEDGNDQISVHYNREGRTFSAELIVWDEGKNDWTSEPLVWNEIKHTIPTLVG